MLEMRAGLFAERRPVGLVVQPVAMRPPPPDQHSCAGNAIVTDTDKTPPPTPQRGVVNSESAEIGDLDDDGE